MLPPQFIRILSDTYIFPPIGDAVMVEYDRYPGQELIAMAHLAAMESARREREEEAKRHILELEDIVLHQPNDFAD
jgi:hypothetical protein